MTAKIIIAYAFSIVAMISIFIMSQQNNKNKLLIFKLVSDSCWAAHYFLLGAIGGVIPNFVGVFRDITFSQRRKKKFFSGIYIPIFFIAANIIIGAFTFSQPINILPICASVLATLSLWMAKPKLTKILLLPVFILFLIYDLSIDPISITGIVNQTIGIFSIILSFIISQIKRIKNKRTDDV